MTPNAIHVVDDDDAVRESLDALLTAEGFATECHGSAEAFLARYDPAAVACLLVDMWLPSGSGADIQARLNALGDPPPIIMFTGRGDIALAVQVMRAGAFHFIEKPFDPLVLVAHVRAALAGRRGQPSADSATRERLARLTQRERQVLEQVLDGHSNKTTARLLGLSPRTVEIYRARVMRKMCAGSLSHLVRMTIDAGFRPATQVAYSGGAEARL